MAGRCLPFARPEVGMARLIPHSSFLTYGAKVTDSPIDALRAAFEARYGRAPAVIARAPGRVTLMGEASGHPGLPVLGMAIERALLVAAAPLPGEPVLRAASTTFEPPVEIVRGAADAPLHAPWHRYLAGALGELADVVPATGAELLIGGDLPPSAGLGSSSALTAGVVAALAAAWGATLTQDDVASRAERAQRHIGIETAGVDETLVTFAEGGAALRVDVDPPARRTVPLPPGLAFVLASSGEETPKGAAARDALNERIVGARIAAAMLADQVGLDAGSPPRLRDVADVEVVDILLDELPEKMSAHEVARTGAVRLEQIVQLAAARFDHMTKVRVRPVARHILAEAVRVNEAEEALTAGHIEAFGRLLDASQASLKDDLRCSTPALDSLCEAMRSAGALGARLTGGGFGGYAFAAVRPESVAAVIEAAVAATGGPAFEVRASAGLELL